MAPKLSLQALGGSTGALSSSGGRGGRAGAGGRRGAPTLRDLVEAGLTPAGRNKITVVYKGVTYTASLGHEGLILYQGAPRALIPKPSCRVAFPCNALAHCSSALVQEWRLVRGHPNRGPLERHRARIKALHAARMRVTALSHGFCREY